MKIQQCENKQIFVEIPLTTQSGKTRVKTRNSFYEYGLPTATRQIPFSQKHYIEWQIGYDVDKNDKEKLALSTGKVSLSGQMARQKPCMSLVNICTISRNGGLLQRVK